VLHAMYSASVIDSALVVCNFDVHTMGQPANVITYPVQDEQPRANTSEFCL